MKIIYNNIIPFKGFAAINLFGILFVRNGITVDKYMINHEKIHTAQMKELGFVFFYLFYFIEWIVRIFQHRFNNKKAYRHISFEKEAFDKEYNLSYLVTRKHYAMWILGS